MRQTALSNANPGLSKVNDFYKPHVFEYQSIVQPEIPGLKGRDYRRRRLCRLHNITMQTQNRITLVQRSCRLQAFSFALLAVAFGSAGRAVEAGPVSIHGAISETAAYSDQYNYLGNTAKTVSLVNDEMTLNGSTSFANGLRLNVQLYAYKIDNYKDLTLDLASLDYSVNERFGMRIGRNKEPWGFYGEEQDVDQIRPFATLPLGQYAKDLRPLDATFDGIVFHGTLNAGRVGSVEYQVFGGRATPASDEQPAVHNIIGASTPINITKFDSPDRVYGARLVWNLPVDGLQFGFSCVEVDNITLHGTVKTAAQLAIAPSDLRYAAQILGPVFSGQPGTITINSLQPSVFADYVSGKWAFAVEAFQMRQKQQVNLPFSQADNIAKSDYYYALATYQATNKLQFGAYYEIDYANSDDHSGNEYHAVPHHLAWTKDLALAGAYNVAPWWVVKIEAHAINGTSILAPGINADAATWKANWGYYVLKTTISF